MKILKSVPFGTLPILFLPLRFCSRPAGAGMHPQPIGFFSQFTLLQKGHVLPTVAPLDDVIGDFRHYYACYSWHEDKLAHGKTTIKQKYGKRSLISPDFA